MNRSLFNWSQFLEDCLQHNYILILGDEIMLDEKFCNGNSWIFLNKMYKESDDEEESKRDFFARYEIPTDNFNHSLRELLELKIFRVIITTTVDNLLERELKKIWHDELNVVNFYDRDNDLPQLCQSSEFHETMPVLYYAFGKVGHGTTFAFDEDSKLEIVTRWLSNNSRCEFPSRFYSYLERHKLLAVGCKQDDWLFRFFWYSLRKSVKSLIDNDLCLQKRDYGTVAIELDENNDRKLKRYLRNNGWLYENNAQQFIKDFLQNMNKDKSNVILRSIIGYDDVSLQEKVINSTIGNFISYASEDFDLAIHLYLALKRKGFHVWLDNKALYPGDEYEKRIENAIKQCDFFLPIISNVTMQDYEQGEFTKHEDEKRFYLKEWNKAIMYKKKIIPILCGDYVKTEMYKSTPWYKGEKDVTVYSLKNDYLQKLVNKLRENNE